jgi:hypothetical protein
MSNVSHHVIRRQYLHVELNGTEADGFALQRILPALYQDALAPAIERVLDRCGPVDGHLSIDRLEIDAGETTLERLEFAIAELVSQAMERSLREEVSRVSSAPPIVARHVRPKTAVNSVTEAFVYFLKTGSLPWSFRLSKGVSLEQAILALWRDPVKASTISSSRAGEIRRVLGSATARQRLTLQFSMEFLETLLLVVSPESKSVLDRVLQGISDTEDSIDIQQFVRHLWETTILCLAEDRVLTPVLLVRETFQGLPQSVVWMPALAEVLERHWPGATEGDPADTTRIERPESLPLKSVPRDARKGTLPSYAGANDNAAKLNEHPDAREGIYVWNAGVVLLHPFLPQLFSALGIAHEDQLLQPTRALGLLHFLTTGELQVPEYELVLPKILCDVALDTSVTYAMDLSLTERDEATALLNAVIRHWNALGDSSPDALRGTFLLRPGKVSLRRDGDWLLQVETKGFDILLDHLPWGFSTIKLPWMKSMLWVEWSSAM